MEQVMIKLKILENLYKYNYGNPVLSLIRNDFESQTTTKYGLNPSDMPMNLVH